MYLTVLQINNNHTEGRGKKRINLSHFGISILSVHCKAKDKKDYILVYQFLASKFIFMTWHSPIDKQIFLKNDYTNPYKVQVSKSNSDVFSRTEEILVNILWIESGFSLWGRRSYK